MYVNFNLKIILRKRQGYLGVCEKEEYGVSFSVSHLLDKHIQND